MKVITYVVTLLVYSNNQRSLKILEFVIMKKRPAGRTKEYYFTLWSDCINTANGRFILALRINETLVGVVFTFRKCYICTKAHFSREKLIIKTLSLILSHLHLDSKDFSLPSDRHIQVNPYTLLVWISKENSHMTEDFGVFGFSFGGA